ncbi:olfactory receptor 10C1-like [Pelodytes ibericus]
MQSPNRTIVTEFLLLGFGNLHSFKTLFFFLFLLIYVMTVLANSMVILLVGFNQNLHSAMYFFLSQLSVSELMFTSNIVPNMLHFVLVGRGTMLVTGCIVQLCLLGVPTVAQCLLLASMSFDRYVAICNPLHYMTIMTFKLQLRLVVACWFLGFLLSVVEYVFLTQLEFCDSNVIDHFYCDIPPVLELSCTDTFPVELFTSLASVPVVLSPFAFITGTYCVIFLTIFRIASSRGRQKAFSTCSSHLTVVCLYYGALTTIYIFPHKKHLVKVNKGLSLLCSVVTPLFNPIIYSLVNKDIRKAMQKSFQIWRRYREICIYCAHSFSAEVNIAMVKKLCQQYNRVVGAATKKTSLRKRNDIWQEVVDDMNEVDGNNQTVELVKKSMNASDASVHQPPREPIQF